MATPRQIAANRRNAQKSTGPVTDAGRAVVSRNAVTHGLTASRAVVLPEEQQDYDRFHAAMREEWLPEGPLEQFHLDRIVDCAWRLKRATRIETSMLFALCQKEEGATEGDPARLGRAYLRGSDAFAKLSRHERQIERSLRQAQYELELAKYVGVTLVSTFYARNLKKFPAPTTGKDLVQNKAKS